MEEEVKQELENPGGADRTEYMNWVLVETMKVMAEKLKEVSARLDELETVRAEIRLRGKPLDDQEVTLPSPVGSPNRSSTPVKTTPELIVKPRDIKVLELEALQKLYVGARLQIFFTAMEQCAGDSYTRLEVAKSRVDDDLALLIHTSQKQGGVKKWEDLKSYLKQEFGTKPNFDQIWRQNDSLQYDSFTNFNVSMPQLREHFTLKHFLIGIGW